MNNISDIQNFDFFKKIIDLPFVKKIILYGSRARSDNFARSDIDLAVECPEATAEEWWSIVEIVEEADTLLSIDCVRLDELDEADVFKQEILKDGIVVYRKAEERKIMREPFLMLGRALEAFKDALAKPMDEDRSNVDLCIHRFEFTIEVFWKVLKRILAYKGVAASNPKEVIRTAYDHNLITDSYTWLRMLNDRNITSHVYNEKIANQIYLRLRGYYPLMYTTFIKLNGEFGSIDTNSNS